MTDFEPSGGRVSLNGAGDPDEAQSLFQYDGIFGNGIGQIPFRSIINLASCDVFVSSGATPLHGAIHRMLIPWNAAIDVDLARFL